MTGTSVVLVLALAGTSLHAATAKVSLPSPLPFLASVPRVHVDVARSHVVVIEEVNLPRGNWRSGDLDFFTAFGAPGMPLALDAHVLPVADGMLEPAPDAMGEALATEQSPRRPPGAHPLLGRSLMAGTVVHMREAAFRRALAPGNMAALRIRTVLRLPEADAQGVREVIVRLGIDGNTPLTLGRIQIASAPREPVVQRAEANLCGKDADPYPLAIGVGKAANGPFIRAPFDGASTPPIAPVLAVRHASDDLGIRFRIAD